MIHLDPPHRPATPDDALPMVELVNFAGEGMPVYLWTKIAASGESAWDIGQQRARRESGGFSYRNTVLREQDGEVVAALIGYPLADDPEPVNYAELPAMFVPLQQLEDMAPGTWYVPHITQRTSRLLRNPVQYCHSHADSPLLYGHFRSTLVRRRTIGLLSPLQKKGYA